MKTRGLLVRYLAPTVIGGTVVFMALIGMHYVEQHSDLERAEAFAVDYVATAERTSAERRAAAIVDAATQRLAPALAAGDDARITDIATQVLQNPDVVSLSVVDGAGRIVVHRSRDPAPAAEASDLLLTDLERRMDSGVISATISTQLDRELGDELVARFRSMEKERSVRWVASLLLTGVLAVTIGGLVARRFARRIEEPIGELIRSADRIGAGDYTRPVPIAGDGDVAELQAALERMRQRLRETTITKDYVTTVLDSMTDAVVVTSPEGTLKRVNAAARGLFAGEEHELIGGAFIDLIAPQDRPAFSFEAAAQDTRETVVITRNGQTIPVSLTGSPISATDPQFQGAIFVIRDITDRKRAERRIRYLARYDALTKVPNRMQFQHLLQQALARARRGGRGIVLLYLDMDRFKEINDTFGHSAGDRTLEILSERLTRTLPKEAVVGRLAGDEFAIFLEGYGGTEDERMAAGELGRLVLSEVGKAFYVQQHEVFLTASLGMAFYPRDAENVIDLIRNADAAMYHSKQNGGNSLALYSPDMNAAAVERLMLKSKLRRALEREEFAIFYQPKVDLHDGRIIGAEALLRWQLPGHGDISPAHFIPLAEETNLILGIGEWVLNRVCSDYRQWMQQIPNPGRVSINLSLKQLHQASFITRCRSVFKRHEVSPACFELEITETTLMADAKRTVKLLDELYAMGVNLSIDDFGTGYSSLSSLQQFPISTLKIDQSFVRDSVIDTDSATIVRTIIDMGRSLDMEVVAEGVETEEQLGFLRERGCHFAQGRLFSDAVSAEDFLALLLAQARGQARIRELFA